MENNQQPDSKPNLKRVLIGYLLAGVALIAVSIITSRPLDGSEPGAKPEAGFCRDFYAFVDAGVTMADFPTMNSARTFHSALSDIEESAPLSIQDDIDALLEVSGDLLAGRTMTASGSQVERAMTNILVYGDDEC